MVVRIVPGWGLSPDRGAIAIAVYAGEFALGLILLAVGAFVARKRVDRTA